MSLLLPGDPTMRVSTLPVLCLLFAGAAWGQEIGGCGSCLSTDLPLVAGIVAGDVALTLLIVAGAYRWGQRGRPEPGQSDGVYMNVRGRLD